MKELISKEQLKAYVNENLSAYEIATRYDITPQSVYNYLEKHGLSKEYESKKAFHHKVIRDLVRSTILQVCLNLAKKASQQYDNSLKASEITLLLRVAESDGLIEKDNTPEIKELKEKLQELKDKNLLINYIVPLKPEIIE